VADTVPPVITCPANIQKLADPIACSAVVAYAATAEDACNGLSLSCDPPSGSTFPTGTWTVHCAAIDCGHNAADCAFNVEIMGPGTPMLSIAYQDDGGILLCWPITCRTYVLQHKANLLSAPGWAAVNLPSNDSNGQHCTRIQGPLEQTGFYRLFSP